MRARLLAASAAALALVGTQATAAQALPQQIKIGTRVSGPDGACADGDNAANDHVRVCFKAHGDKLYVQDRAQDGRSAFGWFNAAETAFAGGDTAACRNPYGKGTWVVCDYSILEHTRVKFMAFTHDMDGGVGDNPAAFSKDETGWKTDWNDK